MKFLTILLLLFSPLLHAEEIVNVYLWAGEISTQTIKQFEKESGIKVNYSIYDNNETMYTKLKATNNRAYDVIMPSDYFVSRMRNEGLLLALNKEKISNFHHLTTYFQNPPYDHNNQYSIPHAWGATGIFVNDQYYDPKSIHTWQDLWAKRFKHQLLLLNDLREVMSIGFFALNTYRGWENPTEIENAYQKLLQLVKNIKVFNSSAVDIIIADEDINVGMAWNGDVYKAKQVNPHIHFIYPQDGFMLWTDCFAIPKNARHIENAYKFINFMLKEKIAKETTLKFGYATTNQAAMDKLPEKIKHNLILYPDKKTLKHGYFIDNVDGDILNRYNHYWQRLKIAA